MRPVPAARANRRLDRGTAAFGALPPVATIRAMADERRSAREWADLLKQNWEQRARSEKRDFYVASHPGWTDPERWRAQAANDAELMLYQVDRAALAGWHVLEIGCGVGRLALPLVEQVASYTGIDIAAGMVEEARRRAAAHPNARFFVSDGVALPPEACDREYRLILVLAVFIHCPRDVIRSLVRAGYERLAPGGQLRFQVLADPSDPTGIGSLEDAAVVHEEIARMEEAATTEERELIDGHYYMGDAFRYDELEPFLVEASGGGGRVNLIRPDLAHVYGWVEKPA